MIETLAMDRGGTRYARVWVRVGANVLDLLMIAALNRVALVATGGWSALQGGRELGASPGKLLLGLRIVDEPTGGRASAWQCVGRYVVALLGMLCAGVGFFWIAIDPRHQGWHDKVVRTLVMRRR